VSRNAVKRSGSVASARPDLLISWCSRLNKDVDPEQVSRGSSRSVWWECEAGHTWRAAVKTRAAGHGCPECYQQSGERGRTSIPENIHANLCLAIEERCVRESQAQARLATLYRLALSHLPPDEAKSLSKKAFGDWLREQGFTPFNSNGRWYRGIAPRPGRCHESAG